MAAVEYKTTILKQLIAQLETSYFSLIATAKEAREAATNDESKAENKYDTRGLEASYLAGAQAERAQELKKKITLLNKVSIGTFSSTSIIGMTAAVKVRVNDLEEKNLFILPFGGGAKFTVQGDDVVVITPESPLGQKIIGQSQGGIFEFTKNREILEYEILSVY